MAKARPRTYTVRGAVLNITCQPHPPGIYKKLFEEAYAAKNVGTIRGTRRGIIRALYHPTERPEIVLGAFGTFTEIDGGPLLDIETGDDVSATDEGYVKYPANLRPNLKHVDFVLHPEKHKLVFDAKGGSPAGVAQMLEELLAPHAEKREIKVRVNPVQHREALEEIWQISRLTKLRIRIKRPNAPDDLADLEEDFATNLEEQNADELDLELRSQAQGGIQPNGGLKRLAELALEDGDVHGEGFDITGKKTKEATVDKPRVEVVKEVAATLADATIRGLQTVLVSFLRK